MTLQSSGAISLSQIQTEFGGSAPISLSEYYRSPGGSYVPNTSQNINIPTSGAISFRNFYSSASVREFYASVAGLSAVNITLPAGTWAVLCKLTGGGGGAGAIDQYAAPGNGGSGTGIMARFQISSPTSQIISLYGANGGSGGQRGGSDIGAFPQAAPGLGYLDGGYGGAAGLFNSSGGGGGGGGAVAVLWYPNSGSSSYTPLSIAGGGGGGAGAGRDSGTGSYANGNWWFRSAGEYSLSATVQTAGNPVWWSNYRFSYSKIASNNGQGSQNMTDFYPPFDEGFSHGDMGAGGGGGGANGWGGGYSGWSWYPPTTTFGSKDAPPVTVPGYWYAPNERTGIGGTNGVRYLNSTYLTYIWTANGGGAVHPAWGAGGVGSGAGGGAGAVSVKVTSNLSDLVFYG